MVTPLRKQLKNLKGNYINRLLESKLRKIKRISKSVEVVLMFDEKKWNLLAYQTMAIDGRCINLTKKINAYLKKNNIGLDKTMEYLKQYRRI